MIFESNASKFEYFLYFLISVMITAAPKYIQTGNCSLNLEFFITFLWTFLAICFLSQLLRTFFIKSALNPKEISNTYVNFILNSKYSLLYITLIILIFWLPIIISLYPGTLINDTWGQLNEYLTFFKHGEIQRGVLSDHHPFFDTLIMGFIITPFGKYLHNWQLGIFTYTMIQSILTAFSFALTVIYAHKKLHIKNGFSLFMIGFYAICPIFPVSVQTVSKDALFSWIYVIFILFFIEAIRTKCHSFNSLKYCIALILTAFFCTLTKKVGLYIILLSFISITIFIPKNRSKTLVVLICTLFLSVGLTGIIKSSLGVTPGGKQEMFSLPFQQTARYYRNYGKDTTKKEDAIIGKVLNMKNLGERYTPTNADPVKGYNDRGTTNQYKNYIKVWFKQGLRHPKIYFSAANAMLAGWFSFTEYRPLLDMSWHSQLNPKLIPNTTPNRKGFFKKSSAIVENVFDNLYNNPLFMLLLSYAFYATLLPAFIIATLWRKWEKEQIKYYWITTIPLILSILLGCWLAPVSIQFEGRRYLYPVIYTLPIMLALCKSVYQIKYSNKNNK